MRKYETIIIIDPDLPDEDRNSIFERLNALILQRGGFLVMRDDWGSKKLAYEIKKKTRGYYVRFEYCGTGTLVDEMERLFRIDDRILKFLTVLLEKDVDVERTKPEMAKTEARANQSAQNNEIDSGGAPVDTPKIESQDSETILTESNPDKEE